MKTEADTFINDIINDSDLDYPCNIEEIRQMSTTIDKCNNEILDGISFEFLLNQCRKYYQCGKIKKIEICDNGIDDDGDGLVDCADPGNNVNKPPYKLEFLYNYINPYNGRVYTNKVAKDKFLLEEYRFTHEAAGLKVKLDTIEKVEIRGYLQNGKWIETFRLKGNSAGYLHNERDWSDSMFVEGAFDLLFPANTFIFEQ